MNLFLMKCSNDEDGSAVVDLTGKPAMVSEEEMITGFYDNLVPTLMMKHYKKLVQMFMRSMNQIKNQDKNGKKHFRGFDLLGLKLKETSEPFEGACTAVHPPNRVSSEVSI